MLWGASYSVRDVLDDPPAVSLSSGVGALDRTVGAFAPGSLLVIAGPRASGVSMLALTYARHAVIEQRMTALVVNSHLHPGDVVRRVASARRRGLGHQDGAGTDDIEPALLTGLTLASGREVTPQHHRASGWTPPEPTHDVIVYDTFDETWPGTPRKTEPAERTAILSAVRDAARIAGTRVIATLRVPSPHGDLRRTRKRWHAHPWYEAAMDAADVIVMTSGYAHPDATNPCAVIPRTGGNWFVSLTITPDHRFRP
jgi:hypothetical protein